MQRLTAQMWLNRETDFMNLMAVSGTKFTVKIVEFAPLPRVELNPTI